MISADAGHAIAASITMDKIRADSFFNNSAFAFFRATARYFCLIVDYVILQRKGRRAMFINWLEIRFILYRVLSAGSVAIQHERLQA